MEENGRGSSNNECLLPLAKPSFSLLQLADGSSRVAFLTLRSCSRAELRSISSSLNARKRKDRILNKEKKPVIAPVSLNFDATG